MWSERRRSATDLAAALSTNWRWRHREAGFQSEWRSVLQATQYRRHNQRLINWRLDRTPDAAKFAQHSETPGYCQQNFRPHGQVSIDKELKSCTIVQQWFNCYCRGIIENFLQALFYAMSGDTLVYLNWTISHNDITTTETIRLYYLVQSCHFSSYLCPSCSLYCYLCHKILQQTISCTCINLTYIFKCYIFSRLVLI